MPFRVVEKGKRKKENGSCLRGRVCAADFFGLPSSTTTWTLSFPWVFFTSRHETENIFFFLPPPPLPPSSPPSFSRNAMFLKEIIILSRNLGGID